LNTKQNQGYHLVTVFVVSLCHQKSSQDLVGVLFLGKHLWFLHLLFSLEIFNKIMRISKPISISDEINQNVDLLPRSSQEIGLQEIRNASPFFRVFRVFHFPKIIR
jgi:hypothetical protein